MLSLRSHIVPLALVILLLLSLATGMYRPLAIAVFLVMLLSSLDKIGKGIVLREMIGLHTSFVCLVMPVLGYAVYNRQEYLAGLFRRYMRVSEETYFDYALPAVIVFCLALCWPVRQQGTVADEGGMLERTIIRIRQHLARNYQRGFYLIGIGMLASFVQGSLPEGIRFFVSLFYFASFAGLLYIYFAPMFRGKWIVILLFLVFLISGSLNSGMFTVIAYMGVTIFSFLVVGKRYSLPVKLGVFLSAVILVVVVQNVKMIYRTYLWNRSYAGDKTSLFTSLFVETIQKGDALFNKRAFFPVHVRLNQGFNVSLVMDRIPKLKPHDGGKALSQSLASSVVPRLLWPDKPEAGGRFNMFYYAGWRIRTLSTNVGPLGEAYGAFGVTGGIVFMFFLGLFIRWAYAQVFRIGERLPLLICWIPVLFYQTTYSAETDTLQIFNSLIKTAFFIWLLYKLFPGWFGGRTKQQAFVPRNALPA